jgi:glycosyltransferase involved in cell wall biosynthesis
VLVVHPRDLGAPTIGGIQTFLHDFVKFSPPDFKITLAGVTQDPRSRPIGRMSEVAIDGRTAWFLPLAPAGGLPRNPARLLAMVAGLIRLRREMLRSDTILQVHRPYRRLFLAGHRGPRVQFIHVDIRDWPGPSAWPRLRGLYRQFSDRALEQMARVFVVNEPGVEIIREQYPTIADRVDFLPVWYDDAVFRAPLPMEKPAIRRTILTRMGLDEEAADDRLILFAGRLDPIKDPELAIDAFAQLIGGGGPAARLFVCGDGEMRAGLEERARSLGVADRVQFMGDRPREELAIIMRACDVLLLTSRAEGGGPRVVLEALASGLPVVAPPVGDVRRTVEHRVDGWLIGDRTPEAVADGLRWVFDQPTTALAEAAVSAARPYTARAVLTRLYDIYRGLSAKGVSERGASETGAA